MYTYVYYEYVLECIGKRSFLQIQTLSVMLGGKSHPPKDSDARSLDPSIGWSGGTHRAWRVYRSAGHRVGLPKIVGIRWVHSHGDSPESERTYIISCEDTVNLIVFGGRVFFLCLLCIWSSFFEPWPVGLQFQVNPCKSCESMFMLNVVVVVVVVVDVDVDVVVAVDVVVDVDVDADVLFDVLLLLIFAFLHREHRC